MALTERLQAIANMIERGETMADIGTDHGFLPLYLAREEICPKVIMTDISPLSLDKARENGEMAGIVDSERILYRVGDGLVPLKTGEVDAVVMAGIGGNLMEDIMSLDPEKTRSFKKYILQPRRHPGRLRHYLWREGFAIEKEVFVRESKFVWEIILARPAYSALSAGHEDSARLNSLFDTNNAVEKMKNEEPDSIVWEAPPYITALKDDLTYEFVKRKLNREELIISSKKDSSKADTEINKKNADYLKSLLAQIDAPGR